MNDPWKVLDNEPWPLIHRLLQSLCQEENRLRKEADRLGELGDQLRRAVNDPVAQKFFRVAAIAEKKPKGLEA